MFSGSADGLPQSQFFCDSLQIWNNTKHKRRRNLVKYHLTFRIKQIEAPLWRNNGHSLDPRITSFGLKFGVFCDAFCQFKGEDKPIVSHIHNLLQDHRKEEDKILVTNDHNVLQDRGKCENKFMVTQGNNLIRNHGSDEKKVMVTTRQNDVQDHGKGEGKFLITYGDNHGMDEENMISDGNNFHRDRDEDGHKAMLVHQYNCLHDHGKHEDTPNGLYSLQVRCKEEDNKTTVKRGHNLRQSHRKSLMTSIKYCGKRKDLEEAKRLHLEALHRKLFPKDVYISTAILSLYIKCGALGEAQKVFDELAIKDVVSWSAIISGYVQHGFYDKALKYFQQMQDEHISPNEVTFICILKACGGTGSIEMGKRIHDEVKKLGLLEKDALLGTTLVDMYAKCGLLGKAREVFEELPNRDVVAWTALITGYAQQGLGTESLKCFIQMRDEGITPNAITFTAILQACASLGSLEMGKEIHLEVKKMGLLGKETAFSTTLMGLYADSGALGKAQEIFDELIGRDVVAWNTLIAGYAHNGLGHEALKCFSRMQDEGVLPNAITFTCTLKGCSTIRCLRMGEEIHAELRDGRLLEKDILLGNTLIDMYAKCGVVEKARKVFEELRERNVVSWSALICGYAQKGLTNEALKCFRKMEDEGFSPDVATFVSILKACMSMESLELGEAIHAEVKKKEISGKDEMLGNTLVKMYAKCGALRKAKEVFKELRAPDVESWNALMYGYTQNDLNGEAIKSFRWMLENGISPNSLTFICILKACGRLGWLKIGKEIHSMINRCSLEKDVGFGNTLMDMYIKCGDLQKAHEVFEEELLIRDVVSCNALIVGYTQRGLGHKVLECFKRMQDEGICPNSVTFICILKTCGSLGLVEIGEEIYAEVQKQGLFGKDIMLTTSFVEMYMKCGLVGKAHKVFEELPVQDIVACNALMAGYAQCGLHDQVLSHFVWMREKGIDPDGATFTSILRTCASLGTLNIGEEIHTEICNKRLLDKDSVLGNALIDMYSKCGMLEKALQVFQELPERDIIAWSTLVSGCAQMGHIERILVLFGKMMAEGVAPNHVIFLGLLVSCSHQGLLDEGQRIFNEMMGIYCLAPNIQHYTCMIDLFSRAGHFNKAISLLEMVPASDRLAPLLSILGACQKWVNLDIGRWAFLQSQKLNEDCPTAYMCMGNIYAASDTS